MKCTQSVLHSFHSELRHEAALACGTALDEGSLVLQNGKCVLEALDLLLSACLSLLVALWLGDASFLNLSIVLHHCRELSVGGVSVSRELSNLLVQACSLLGLVLGILGLGPSLCVPFSPRSSL